MDRAYDVAIVGSGAGGAAAAFRLARAGLRVALLERGAELPADGSTLDPRKVLAEGAFKSREAWLDRHGRRFEPEEFFNLGGKTRWYGAALLRFTEDEFAADPERGFLPWPLPYAEMARYYDEAEQLLGVRRFDIERDLARIAGRVQRNGAGWRCEPLQLGLAAGIRQRRDLATRFDGFALPDGYKADACSRLLREVAKLPNLEIVTGARVVNLLADPADGRRVAGVVAEDGRRFSAATVVLAAGALHSPRLLQAHLDGRGGAPLPVAAQVGRRYKRHVLTAVLGFGWRAQSDLLRKTALFLNRRFPHSSVQPLGGWVDREIVLAMVPRFVPRFLAAFFARRVYGFFLQTEEGSHPDNRVRALDGTAQLDYDLARTPHAESEHRGLVRAFLWALLRAGFLPVAKRIPLAGSAHSVGTLTAGTNPADSAVDADGRVHGFDNLYVADGSVLPRIGRLNPALTIYAWGLRLADHLLRRHRP